MPAPALRRLAVSLWGRQARRRWAYLVLGGALVMPYLMATLVVAGLVVRSEARITAVVAVQVLSFVAALPIAAATAAAVPAVRVLEGNAARVLLGGPFAHLPTGRATAPGARARSAAWFALHLGVGGLISGLSLAVPPFAAVALVAPMLTEGGRSQLAWVRNLPPWWGPPLGLALFAALVLAVAGSGRLLAHYAPRLLGPTPAEALADRLGERLAAAERRAARLGERNRIARELHDSVGHALSVVTLQAGAAGRVLDRDPQFARRALDAIEQSARGALEELDQVLGLLRDRDGEHESGRYRDGERYGDGEHEGERYGDGERYDNSGHNGERSLTDPAHRAPQPDLTRLGDLLEAARAAGADLRTEHLAPIARLAELPATHSRAAYRIVQEGLTNALRHGGPGPVHLALQLSSSKRELTITMSNPRTTAHRPRRTGGGHGLPGITERATALGGTAVCGPDGDGHWSLDVRLPLRPGTAPTLTPAPRRTP